MFSVLFQKKLIRFSTYGSGIVDFKIEGGSLSVNDTAFNKKFYNYRFSKPNFR